MKGVNKNDTSLRHFIQILLKEVIKRGKYAMFFAYPNDNWWKKILLKIKLGYFKASKVRQNEQRLIPK